MNNLVKPVNTISNSITPSVSIRVVFVGVIISLVSNKISYSGFHYEVVLTAIAEIL